MTCLDKIEQGGKEFMNQIKVNGLTRITRATAKKVFKAGGTIYGCPCNVLPTKINSIRYDGSGEATFDYIDNSAYFYNCHDSRGNQMFYYIDDEVASGLGK